MAKGDKKRAQNQLDYMGNQAREKTQFQQDVMLGDAQRQRNVADNATQRNFQDYDKIMGGYEDWSKTGGYSNDDLQNIRSRATSPIRSIYSSARRELDRGQNLSGGYMPNKAAGEAKMAREMSYALSDKSTDANAQIAQMVHQGKAQGMEGMRSTYGTTPANSALHEGLYGDSLNRMLGANQQGNQLNMQIAGLQQGVGNQPGNGIMGALGNIANIAKAIPWPGGGDKPPLPNNSPPQTPSQAPVLGGGGAPQIGGNTFQDPAYIDYLNQPVNNLTPNVDTSYQPNTIALPNGVTAIQLGNGLYYSPESGIYYNAQGEAVEPPTNFNPGLAGGWSDVPPGY